jgi:hypothetical protein
MNLSSSGREMEVIFDRNPSRKREMSRSVRLRRELSECPVLLGALSAKINEKRKMLVKRLTNHSLSQRLSGKALLERSEVRWNVG